MNLQQYVHFRIGAGAFIYDDKNCLVFHRTDTSTHPWQFPQGGMNIGEDPKAGMWRELFEETALQPSDFSSVHEYPGWTGYHYDTVTLDHLSSQNIATSGQAQRWFFLKMKPGTHINLELAQDKEFSAYRWIPLNEILGSVVPFKCEMYQTLLDYFETHIRDLHTQ